MDLWLAWSSSPGLGDLEPDTWSGSKRVRLACLLQFCRPLLSMSFLAACAVQVLAGPAGSDGPLLCGRPLFRLGRLLYSLCGARQVRETVPAAGPWHLKPAKSASEPVAKSCPCSVFHGPVRPTASLCSCSLHLLGIGLVPFLAPCSSPLPCPPQIAPG